MIVSSIWSLVRDLRMTISQHDQWIRMSQAMISQRYLYLWSQTDPWTLMSQWLLDTISKQSLIMDFTNLSISGQRSQKLWFQKYLSSLISEWSVDRRYFRSQRSKNHRICNTAIRKIATRRAFFFRRSKGYPPHYSDTFEVYARKVTEHVTPQ